MWVGGLTAIETFRFPGCPPAATPSLTLRSTTTLPPGCRCLDGWTISAVGTTKIRWASFSPAEASTQGSRPRFSSIQKSGLQNLCVMLQMIGHERLNEKVPMVIARLHAEREFLSRRRGRGGEFFGQQLLVREELIGRALVYQDVRREGLARHELGRIMFAPGLLIGTQVIGERLLSPRGLHRRGDGRERRYGPVLRRIAQCECQGAVASHRVAEDPGGTGQGGQIGRHGFGKFAGDIAVHAVIRRPW